MNFCVDGHEVIIEEELYDDIVEWMRKGYHISYIIYKSGRSAGDIEAIRTRESTLRSLHRYETYDDDIKEQVYHLYFDRCCTYEYIAMHFKFPKADVMRMITEKLLERTDNMIDKILKQLKPKETLITRGTAIGSFTPIADMIKLTKPNVSLYDIKVSKELKMIERVRSSSVYGLTGRMPAWIKANPAILEFDKHKYEYGVLDKELKEDVLPAFNMWLKEPVTKPECPVKLRWAEFCNEESEAEKMGKAIEIENVIYNNPATIVFWKDGTKTVVKASNEEFDPEKGLAMAYVKKLHGNTGKYNDKMKKWIRTYGGKEKVATKFSVFGMTYVEEDIKSTKELYDSYDKSTTWKQVKEYPAYEINGLGEVRNAQTLKAREVKHAANGMPYYMLYDSHIGRSVRVSLNQLFELYNIS